MDAPEPRFAPNLATDSESMWIESHDDRKRGPVTDTVPMDYRVVITEEIARRCARAAGRYMAFRRNMLIVSALYVFLMTVIGIAASMLTDTPGVIPVFVVFGVVFAVAFPTLQFATTARSVRRQCPIGEEWTTGFGTGSMRLETLRSTSEIAYSAFEGMIVRDGVVLLRRTIPRGIASIPVELMPTEAQQRFATHLS